MLKHKLSKKSSFIKSILYRIQKRKKYYSILEAEFSRLKLENEQRGKSGYVCNWVTSFLKWAITLSAHGLQPFFIEIAYRLNTKFTMRTKSNQLQRIYIWFSIDKN